MSECECGCGQDAGTFREWSHGHRKGEPRRFVSGHNTTVPAIRVEDREVAVEPGGCWKVPVRADRKGYVSTRSHGRFVRMHKLFYEHAHGPVPEGMSLDHICHDPKVCAGGNSCPHRACVNPDHMAVVEPVDNTRRRSSSRLSMEEAREIRSRLQSETAISLARQYNVFIQTISQIKHDRIYREGV